ncbi:hypothetical protein [Algibacillus agarilyticus]|uniref:hypothetical protein n=1 Tax=Algibacillus agarilyticus TaxID=2234133 RepID=UPI000DCF69FC|nr:hypothetical protein [Algibacillus agarilyticus]
MGFLKSLFSGRDKTEIRHVTHVSQLRQGDAVEFSDSFALPELLRKQTFVIESVNTYQYERSDSIEYVLQGNTPEKLFLSYEKDDDDGLNISLKVNRDSVGALFDLNQFGLMFENDSRIELALQEELTEFSNWVAPVYFQHAAAVRGYFYKQDFRPAKPPEHDDRQSLAFDYFGLSSADEKFSVDVEVWEDGETDVILTIHRPVTDIIGLYPGEK